MREASNVQSFPNDSSPVRFSLPRGDPALPGDASPLVEFAPPPSQAAFDRVDTKKRRDHASIRRSIRVPSLSTVEIVWTPGIGRGVPRVRHPFRKTSPDDNPAPGEKAKAAQSSGGSLGDPYRPVSRPEHGQGFSLCLGFDRVHTETGIGDFTLPRIDQRIPMSLFDYYKSEGPLLRNISSPDVLKGSLTSLDASHVLPPVPFRKQRTWPDALSSDQEWTKEHPTFQP